MPRPALYLKSLVVFVLCTVFVVGFVLVLNYATAGVSNTSQGSNQSAHACPTQPPEATGFIITSAALHTFNFTDELGIVNYATLALGVNASAGQRLSSILVCVRGSLVGTAQGPFNASVNRVVSFTLPATISISTGKAYDVTVEGFYGNGSTVWGFIQVTAQ